MEGLHGKYLIYKAVEEPVRMDFGHGVNIKRGVAVDGDAFVLRYDRDPHAQTALLAYADACEAENPVLARDLREAIASLTERAS